MDDKATAVRLAELSNDPNMTITEMVPIIVAALEAARDTAFAAGYAAGKVQLHGIGVNVELQRNPDSPYRDCIIDCTGEPVVRRVLGNIPLTEDGAVVATGGVVYFIAHGGTGLMRATADDVRKGWVRSPECWSTESAAKAAMEGGKA